MSALSFAEARLSSGVKLTIASHAALTGIGRSDEKYFSWVLRVFALLISRSIEMTRTSPTWIRARVPKVR
jgi:hypothetical protein